MNNQTNVGEISRLGLGCGRMLRESMKSLEVHLNESDVKIMEEAIPANEIAGGSFPQMQFKNGMVVHH